MTRIIDYLYIFLTIAFTVYGQLILKLRLSKYGPLPDALYEKLKFLAFLLLDPGIFSGFAAGFLASLAWMTAMTKFDLNHAYPFMSLNFVIVLILSGYFLNESITPIKVFGMTLIVMGTVVASRG